MLEALPAMRGSRAFAAYVEVCDTGRAFVNEVTYDTPFGDGYMLGTFLHRAAKLGDGLVVFLHDVTEERRMEAELKTYADLVAHDLSAPWRGSTRSSRSSSCIPSSRRRRSSSPSSGTAPTVRAGWWRACSTSAVGGARGERVALSAVMADVSRDLRPLIDEAGGTLRSASCRRCRETRAAPPRDAEPVATR